MTAKKGTQGPKPKKPRAPRGGGPLRRRRAVPVLGGGQKRDEQVLGTMGAPLDQCLSGPVSDLIQSQKDVNAVAQGMTLPVVDEDTLKVFAGWLFRGQHELSVLTAGGLAKQDGIVTRSKVTPDVLDQGRRKLDVIFRGKHTAIQGQNLVADGRLYLRAKFTFFFKLVMALYERWVLDPSRPLGERMRLAEDFRRVDAIRFRQLSQKVAALQQTAQDKQAMSGQIEDQLNENAFLEARRLLDQGHQPDLQTLGRAIRHAQRLQQQAEQLPETPAPSPGPDRRTEIR